MEEETTQSEESELIPITSNDSNETSSKPITGNQSLNSSSVIIIIILLISNVLLYLQIYHANNNYKLLSEDFTTYKAKSTANYADLAEKLHSINDKYVARQSEMDYLEERNGDTHYQIACLSNITAIHEKMLIRFTNRTTNADVLDELHTVKDELNQRMVQTSLDIEKDMVLINHNVSKQLLHSKKEENNVLKHAHTVVNNASDTIHGIQSDMLDQMVTMSVTLNTTLSSVTSIVDKAKDNIQNQVADVQSNINAYVAFSNKQFAAENDFVKYQLAGMFYVYCV